MAKQKRKETQKEQSERFRKAAQDMINAGELNPIDADELIDKLVKRSANGDRSPKQ